MGYIIGVDLGSSNSCAAVYRENYAEIIELPDGSRLLPSVVAIVDGECLIGREALERGKAAPEFMFRYFKRRLGERYTPEADTGPQSVPDADGLVAWKGPGGHIYTTIELAALIIGELLSAAEIKLNERPDGAVICVPAEFGEAQKAAVLAAGVLAGLDKDRIHLMHEPTAAALAFGFDFRKIRRIAVVDLGGGTADVSIISTGKGKSDHSLVEVKATDGRLKGLGGIDFDERIAQFLLTRWQSANPDSNASARDAARRRVLDQAEYAKIRLSTKPEARVRIDDFDVDAESVSLHMDDTVRVAEFDEMTAKLREAIVAICKRAVDRAREKDGNFSVKDINDVVLVGGMTRVPAIRDAIRSYFGKEPRKDINPEEAVALGAAIQAARIMGRKTGLTVSDITSQTISLEILRDVASIIFPAGTSYPAERSIQIRNEADGQRSLSLRILQGGDGRASACERIASYDHPIADAGPAQTVKLQLVCKIDASGRFSAEAENWKHEAVA